MRQGSSIALNPAIDEAFALYQWRMSGGESAPSASMSTGGGAGGPITLDQRIAISTIKDEGLGMKEKPDYVSVKGTVTYIRHENGPWYTACPSPNCNRKVSSLTSSSVGSSLWRWSRDSISSGLVRNATKSSRM
jgi:replication factor A1